MRFLFLTAAVVFSLGCGASWAQIVALPNVTAPPVSTQAPTFPAPASSSRPLGAVAGTLGTIQLSLGGPIAGSTLGVIQTCPASVTAGTTASFPVDATDATTNGAPGFGTSEMSGNCSPGSAPSSPGIISGLEFSDGAVPLNVTEGSGSGLSPLIAVPITAVPSAACAESPVVPTPSDSAGAIGIPSLSSC